VARSIRDGMGQSSVCVRKRPDNPDHQCVDLDWWGVIRPTWQSKDGMIAAIGKARESGYSAWGRHHQSAPGTEVIAGEGQ